MKELNKYFDHTLLKPEATKEQIKKLCAEAKEYDFYSVCVNGCHVSLAAKELKGTDVKVAAVIGFPLGAMSSDVKSYETMKCCEDGASEIDMVMNIGAMKEKDYIYVASDIAGVVETASKYGAIVKVILETCLLTNEEISKACGSGICKNLNRLLDKRRFGSSRQAYEKPRSRQSSGKGIRRYPRFKNSSGNDKSRRRQNRRLSFSSYNERIRENTGIGNLKPA